jgi:hypothetical protein
LPPRRSTLFELFLKTLRLAAKMVQEIEITALKQAPSTVLQGWALGRTLHRSTSVWVIWEAEVLEVGEAVLAVAEDQ